MLRHILKLELSLFGYIQSVRFCSSTSNVPLNWVIKAVKNAKEKEFEKSDN